MKLVVWLKPRLQRNSLKEEKMQLKELALYIKTELEKVGINQADSETRVILREIAKIDTGYMLAHPTEEIDAEIFEKISSCINRRLIREPLQYILGNWDFMGLNFFVGKGALIPRPDTEILVETALSHLHDGMRFLDLCTGTGCIAISLLHYSNDCEGVAVDISPEALEIAATNQKRILGQEDKADSLKLIRADLFEGVTGMFDIIVSNPPYIDTKTIETLEAEVKTFEPMLALDGGADGLDLVRRIIDNAEHYLCGGGWLMLEIGADQGEATMKLMENAGFIEVECIKDYAGHDRVVIGCKSSLTCDR